MKGTCAEDHVDELDVLKEVEDDQQHDRADEGKQDHMIPHEVVHHWNKELMM